MTIYPERLAQNLQSLQQLYLVWGDEPLIVNESCDLIRQAILAKGDIERLRYQVDTKFEWDQLFDQCQSLSLFNPLRLIELHLEKLPDKNCAAHLTELINELPHDICLLMTCPQLSTAQQKAHWYQTIDARGVIVSVYIPTGNQLNQWIHQRLASRHIQPSGDLSNLLVHYYEGNLLAMAQAIDNIALQWPKTLPPLQQIESGLAQSSHFNHYQLVDALMGGDIQRSRLIARQLKAEGEDLTLINWLIDRDLTLLRQLQQSPTQSQNLFSHFKIWRNRQSLLQQAALRISAQQIHQGHLLLGQLDISIKGLDGEQGWFLLEQLSLTLHFPNWQLNYE